MSKIFIFGHKNPDTDAICSTIAYASYKEKKGFQVIPARLGDLNNETKFVLKFIGVEEPEMLDTIKTQVSDLEIDEPISINPDATLKSAWNRMLENNIKALTVTDGKNRLAGIITLSDITRSYMDMQDEYLLLKSGATLKNIMETLNASLIAGHLNNYKISGRVLVAALEYDRLKYFIKKDDIIITGNREDCIWECIKTGASLIITTCNIQPERKTIEYAEKLGSLIISTPYDTFTAARMIHQSIPVSFVMTKEKIESVKIDDFIDDVREKMLKTRYRCYPVLNKKNKVLGMASRYHLISRKRKQAILIDHNEKSQTAAGIDDAEIIEIIDHHRLGDIQTNYPILMINEPVGSTATIIAKMYIEEKELLSPKIAGLLLSAIISDTLKFMSPTSTGQDFKTAQYLAKIADIDIDDFALKLFNAGTDLRGKTIDEIINQDLKEYRLGKYKIGMSQVYSMNSESITDFKDNVMERMEYYCGKNGFSLLILLITDLFKNGSEIVFTGERKDLVLKAFLIEPDAKKVFLPGVLSRKKQVVPKILSLENDLII